MDKENIAELNILKEKKQKIIDFQKEYIERNEEELVNNNIN
jgi:hypothetical protein